MKDEVVKQDNEEMEKEMECEVIRISKFQGLDDRNRKQKNKGELWAIQEGALEENWEKIEKVEEIDIYV